MKVTDKHRDPVPEEFGSEEEAAEFWDTHSLADYEEILESAEVDVNIRRRRFVDQGSGEPNPERETRYGVARDGADAGTRALWYWLGTNQWWNVRPLEMADADQGWNTRTLVLVKHQPKVERTPSGSGGR